MTLKAVFFDLDGTLLDTSLDLGNALNNVRLEEQLPLIDHHLIRSHVSNGATALIQLGFGHELTEDMLSLYRSRLLDFYLAGVADHTHAFPGIYELIDALTAQGVAWGIVTNKPSTYTRALLAHIDFPQEPCAIVCPDHVGVGKPSPEPLFHACRLAGCQPAEALYVGDHLRDIECGTNAGVATIAVGYGFTADPEDYLHWNATHVARHPEDIWPIVQLYLQE